MVNVKYHGILIKLTGKKEEEYSSKKLKDLLSEVKKRYGQDAYKYAKMSYIMINDQNAGSLKAYNTPLSDGDIVELLPVCGGG